MPISHLTAVGRDHGMPHAALVTFVLEKVSVDNLQVNNAPANQGAAKRQQTDDQPKAPGVQTAVGLEPHHGFTSITSRASGTRMPS